MNINHHLPLATGLACCLTVVGCSSDSSDAIEESIDNTIETTAATGAIDTTLFLTDALAFDPVVVDCTLDDGTETTCYEITNMGAPAEQEVGPFCPQSITTTSDDAGLWLDGTGTVHQADGNFILDLPNIYGDSNWMLYDEATGLVNVTDTQEACEAAARPDVDVAYQNYCVQCEMEYIDGGISTTYTIPTTPIPADVPGSLGAAVGIALNGSEISAPAPVADILAAYTIAAFDDCGGHVNTHQGYHYHAATGCTEVGTQGDGHSSLLGFALDGYGIYGELDSDGLETTGLDECRGITDETRGYHYHAASAGENLFIGCYNGKVVVSEDDRPDGPPPGDGGGAPAGVAHQ